MHEGLPLSLLMIDIDKFRVYNEAYGRPQGDRLLQTLAGVLTSTLRHPDGFVARFGRPEFAVLLPDADMTGALLTAEELRANVKATVIIPVSRDTAPTAVTVSIGVATVVPSGDLSADDLMAMSGQALLTAKHSGGNTVWSRSGFCVEPAEAS